MLRAQGSSLWQWIFLSPLLYMCVLLDTNICTYVFCITFTIITIIVIFSLMNCKHTHVCVELADTTDLSINKFFFPVLI